MTEVKCLKAYRPVVTDPTFETILYGGSMSGKTFFAIDWLWMEGLRSPEGFSLFIMEDMSSSRSDGFEAMCGRLDDLGIPYTAKGSPNLEIELPSRHRIIFISSSRSSGERSKERMKKYTDAHRVVVNEATAVREDDYRMIVNRMGRSYEDARIVCTFNPIDADNWAVARWVLPFLDGRPLPDGTRVIHTTHRDNPELAESARQRLIEEGKRNINYHRVYELGEPGVLEGLVYVEGADWDIIEDEDWPIDRGIPLDSMGVDFGFGTNAAVAVWVCDGGIYARQLVYDHEKRQDELESELMVKLNSLGVDYRRLRSCRCDHEMDRILSMRQAGFNATEAYKDVLIGIEQVKERRIHIHAESRDLIKELRNYCWDEKTLEGDIDRKPLKGFDHACDALRYALSYKPVDKVKRGTVRPKARYH